jgi:hypothetical protein
MNDAERELVRAFEDVPVVAVQGEFLEELHRRIDRRRRSRRAVAVLTATATTTAVVAVLSTYSLAGHSTEPVPIRMGSAQPAPWVNQPVEVDNSAEYPACGAAEMQGRAEPVDAGLGVHDHRLLLWFTNRGSQPCTLSGYASDISVELTGGGRVSGTTVTADPHVHTAPPANLKPGERAAIVFSYSDECDTLPPMPSGESNATATAFRVPAPGGGEVTIAFPAATDTPCNGFRHTAFTYSAFTTPAAATSELNGLVITISAPRAATSGDTVTYTVTLHNPSDRDVIFNRCPIYTQYMGAGYDQPTDATVGQYRLNCDETHGIKAGDSATFAMQIEVPAGQGSARLEWGLDDSIAVAALPGPITLNAPETRPSS